jgi:hypothetical protein
LVCAVVVSRHPEAERQQDRVSGLMKARMREHRPSDVAQELQPGFAAGVTRPNHAISSALG